MDCEVNDAAPRLGEGAQWCAGLTPTPNSSSALRG
jgi:hypothetical protein